MIVGGCGVSGDSDSGRVWCVNGDSDSGMVWCVSGEVIVGEYSV